jgi:hypothetical protein
MPELRCRYYNNIEYLLFLIKGVTIAVIDPYVILRPQKRHAMANPEAIRIDFDLAIVIEF